MVALLTCSARLIVFCTWNRYENCLKWNRHPPKLTVLNSHWLWLRIIYSFEIVKTPFSSRVFLEGQRVLMNLLIAGGLPKIISSRGCTIHLLEKKKDTNISAYLTCCLFYLVGFCLLEDCYGVLYLNDFIIRYLTNFLPAGWVNRYPKNRFLLGTCAHAWIP